MPPGSPQAPSFPQKALPPLSAGEPLTLPLATVPETLPTLALVTSAHLASLLVPQQDQHTATPRVLHRVPATRKPLPSQVLSSFPHFLQTAGSSSYSLGRKETPSAPSHPSLPHSLHTALPLHFITITDSTQRKDTQTYFIVYSLWPKVSLHNGLPTMVHNKSAPHPHPSPRLLIRTKEPHDFTCSLAEEWNS